MPSAPAPTRYPFTEVDEDEAERVRIESKPDSWLDALVAGKMIKMERTPKVGTGIVSRTDKTYTVRSYPAPDGGVYVWLDFKEDATA